MIYQTFWHFFSIFCDALSVYLRLFILLKCVLVAKYLHQQKMLVYCVTHWHPLAELYEPPWNVLWASDQPPVPDPYSQSLVCATWTIPRASTQISLPQSYESNGLTSPFSIIAHFFPGLAIICLTPSLPGFRTVRQMVWCKTTDKFISLHHNIFQTITKTSAEVMQYSNDSLLRRVFEELEGDVDKTCNMSDMDIFA